MTAHDDGMAWQVEFHPAFNPEFDEFPKEIRKSLLSQISTLAERGPNLGRPAVDTLKGSQHSNMKELRFKAGQGEWRAAFAFDTQRIAIVLVMGNKRGQDERRFYKRLIRVADSRFKTHLDGI